MSKTIDQRVVEMNFENQQFEKNVSTSMGSIDKLKKSLDFKDAGKSFGAISAAAGKVSLGHIADGINNIASRFSAMSIIGITALVNLANAAIQAGTRIVKALTIDPIQAGMTEYETKLNSIQTILANTQKEGTTLGIVTKALDELNTYSDKTIYNFQQMTRNVGTFTAAGVSLKDSVASIKGIANLAAVSGSNAEQASTAMYQLSQALASGTVKLMDWNSVVNAGMGGQVFQEAIKETARVHGVAIDQMIKEDGSFRETLQRGWFTSEILTETLSKFTGDLNEQQLKTMGYSEQQIKSIMKLGKTANDAATKVKTFSQLFDTMKEAAQSGWAKTWEIIIGNFDEAKDMLTKINDVMGGMIGASADARNNLLQGWKDLGGRNALIQAAKNAFEGILSIIKPIKQALREIFPPMTAKQLYNITKGLEALTAKMKLSGAGAEKLRRIFKGVFALLDIIVMAVSAVTKAIFGFSGSLNQPITNITDFLVKVADFIVKMRDSAKATDFFTKAIQGITKVLKTVIDRVKDFFSKFAFSMDAFKGIKLDGLKSFMDNLQLKFEPLKKLGDLTKKFLTMIGTLVKKVAPIALKLGSIVADGFGKFVDKIMGALDNFDPQKVFAILNGGLLAGVLLAIRKFISKGSGMFDGVSGILDSVKNSMVAWQTSVKADTLLKIAAALGILTLSIVALSMIDSKKLAGALGAMTVMFAELGLSMGAFTKVSSAINPLDMIKMSVGLLAISTAMLIMSLALAKLGKLSGKELLKGIMAIATLVAVIKITANTLSESSVKMITGAVALVIFSVALRSFGAAVKKLGDLDVETLAKGLVGVGVLMTELAIFLRTTDISGMGMVKAVGLLVMAAALNLIVVAVSKLAAIDIQELGKGIIALGVILTMLGVFVTATGGAPTFILTAAALGIVAASMLMLASVLEKIAKISWEGIAKGLVAIGVALTLIGAAAYLIPPTLILQAAGLVVMAGALVILAKALSMMADMSWEGIAKSLITLAVSLGILAMALSAMSGTLMGSAALFVASAALLMLAPALKALGSMSWEEIARGLVALAGTFVVLGVAGALMTPVIPTLLALAGAMLLLGVASAAVGLGMLAFSAGLATLAISGSAGAAALVVVLTSIVGLVPMLAKQLGLAILILVDTLVKGAPTLLEGVVTLLTILIDGLMEITPKIVKFVIGLVETLLTELEKKLPAIAEAGYNVTITFLKGIRDNIGEIATIGYDIVIKFINAVALKLPELVQAAWNFVISWIDAMTAAVNANMPRLIESVRGLALAIITGLVKGLMSGQAETKATIVELGKIIINGFKETLGIHSPSSVFFDLALNVVQGLINGLLSKIGELKNAAVKLVADMLTALKGKYDSMVGAGRDLVTGFAQGIQQYIGSAVQKAGELAAAVLAKIRAVLDSHSPSKETIDIGKDVDDGMAIGISKYAKVAVNSAKDMTKQTLGAFSGMSKKIAEVIASDPNFSPTITPVVDTSQIEVSAAKIESLFGSPTLNASASFNAAKAVLANAPSLATPQTTQPGTTSVNYTQNNYSPKALNRAEIYRLTKNQLIKSKGLVGAL